MPAKLYRAHLTAEERRALQTEVNTGRGAAGRLKRARILLMADEAQPNGGWQDADIVSALSTSRRTVERTRKACVERGIEAALNHRQPYKSRRKVLDGAAEARLVQLACSEAPEGRESWTMQLLADKLVELEVVEQVSRETVRQTLKKTNLSPG
jgi:hypothetical protein